MTFPSKDGSNYADSITTLVLLPFVWIFIITRLYVRVFITKRPGWDDFTCFAAGLVYSLQCVAVMLLNYVTSTVGYPPSIDRIVTSYKWYVTTASAYAISSFLVKLSVGLGFLRILNVRHLVAQWERIFCYTCILVSCAVNLELFFYVLFQCKSKGVGPGSLALAMAQQKCSLVNSGLKTSTYVQTATNVAIDLILVILPIPSFFMATMDLKMRTSLIFILFLGVGGLVASVIRLAFLDTFFVAKPNTGSVASVVSHVEIAAFIICGCSATFHPLLSKLFPGAEILPSGNRLSLQFHKDAESAIGGRESPKRQSSDGKTV